MTQKATQLISFLIAKCEGGYANIKGDAGGETYCGIARNYWPQWEGWRIIDEYKKRHNGIRHNTIIDNKRLTELVYAFYEEHFYKRLWIEEVEERMMYAHLFCYGVHAGAKTAARMAQEAANAVEGHDYLKVDGVVGPKTLFFLNGEKREEVAEEFVRRVAHHYSGSRWAAAFEKRLNTISIWAREG